MKESVGIIGYGRFGQVLADLLKTDYVLKVYEPTLPASSYKNLNNTAISFIDLKKIAQEKTLFIAVPISHFADLIQQISPYLQANTTVIDVCSVKVYPVKIMLEILPKEVGIIATHPLFGPDSIHTNTELKIMMHATRDTQNCFTDWKAFFQKKNLHVLEMTPEAHDQFAAGSQGITHLIGRVLADLKVSPTPIDTVGFEKLCSVMEQTCHDTPTLFHDLNAYNPYSNKMLEQFQISLQKITEQLKD